MAVEMVQSGVPVVTVFGGSGFIGRYVVAKLASDGWQVRVAVRDTNEVLPLQPCGDVSQVVPLACNIRDEASVANAVMGAKAVVNLVGILYESGKQRFDAIQAQGPGTVARCAKEAGVEALVQMSAIGADLGSDSAYARTKAMGEEAAKEAFPTVSIIRPSVVFGPEDDFFNRFADMALMSPFLPLIGGGRTHFQPVYVGDVAEAIRRCVNNPRDFGGKTFELGGPRVMTFRQCMELLLKEIERERWLVNLPMPLAYFQAFFMEWLPTPPLTRDQVRLLKRDNVVSEGALTLEDLGIAATDPDLVLPDYLVRFRPDGQYSKIK